MPSLLEGVSVDQQQRALRVTSFVENLLEEAVLATTWDFAQLGHDQLQDSCAGTGVAEAFVPGTPLLENADVDPAVPAEDEAETAQNILDGAGLTKTLYARVDLIRQLDGMPVLMELELVEPSLFLWHGGDKAKNRLADGIIRRLG